MLSKGTDTGFFGDIIGLLMKYLVSQQLSIVAIDEESGKLVGVFTGLDNHKLEQELGFFEGFGLMWNFMKLSRKYKQFEPAGPILEKIKEPMVQILSDHMKKNNLKSKVGIEVEMLTVATDLSFTGKGIGSNVTRLLVENA